MKGKPAAVTVDERTFLLLYQRTARPLQAYIIGMCRDHALAQDILQEAYMRFLGARLPQMDERGMKSYLFKIAANLLMDHFRRQKREMPGQEAVEAEPAPEEDQLVKVDMQLLFAKLPFRERQLLWLCHVEGYSHEEAAGIVGVGARSVRVLLHRIRRKFAAMIRGSGWKTEGDA